MKKHSFAHAANLLAAARVPADVAAALSLSRLTVLRKPGGIRGIAATGDTFRRVVSHGLVAWFSFGPPVSVRFNCTSLI